MSIKLIVSDKHEFQKCFFYRTPCTKSATLTRHTWKKVLFQSWAQFLSQKDSCGDCFQRYCGNTQMLLQQVFPKFLQEKHCNKSDTIIPGHIKSSDFFLLDCNIQTWFTDGMRSIEYSGPPLCYVGLIWRSYDFHYWYLGSKLMKTSWGWAGPSSVQTGIGLNFDFLVW